MGRVIVRSLDPKAFILEVDGKNVDVVQHSIIEVEESQVVEDKINKGKFAVISRIASEVPAVVEPTESEKPNKKK